MSYDHPTETWAIVDIDRMLEVLQVVETPGFEIATWPDRTHVDANGEIVRQFPYPDYHPAVDEFWRLCYETSAFIDPYALLPEDPPGLDADMVAVKVLDEVADIEGASLNQIRRYFVICTRGERFCDGYMAAQFENGLLQAAVKRLRDLRSAMGGES